MIEWPAVFNEPIDAPYHPGDPEWARQGSAIADGLMAWGNCHAGRELADRLPASFGHVMLKLAGIAGIVDHDHAGWSAAQKTWMAEHGNTSA